MSERSPRTDLGILREVDRELLEAYAVAMHALTWGDWQAAGWETKERFRHAAFAALTALGEVGIDRLHLAPPSIRGEMPW